MITAASTVEPAERKQLHPVEPVFTPVQDDPEAREDARLLHAIAQED
jgi:hypothetical protein